MAAIYKISSISKSSRFYIGSAVNPPERWLRHISQLRKGRHCNQFLQRHYNSHGEKDFLFSIVENCEVSQLIEREQFYLNLLQPGINLCLTAGSRLGVTSSLSTRMKISASWKHRPPRNMESRLYKPRH